MKKHIGAGLFILMMAGMTLAEEKEMPKMTLPEPQPEHAWLMQLVGVWDAEVEKAMPGMPAEKTKGLEAVRAVGGFWTLSDFKGIHMDKPFTGFMVLGYDPAKKKYTGAWIDSMTSHMWNYEGTLDESRKILTLFAEGPCPSAPGRLVKFKEVLEITSSDERVFTSFMQDEKGEWVKVMTVHYKLKK